MTYEQDFYNYLATHADATALRALVSSRIYWLQLPQPPTFPAVRVNQITAAPGFVLEGNDSWQETRLQVSIFDTAHAVCVSVREALRTLLHGKRITHGTTVFSSIRMTDINELWIDDTPGGYLHMPIDFNIFHTTT